MDLGEFDQPEAHATLAEVIMRPTTDPDLAETCAESLAQIWCRRGSVDQVVFSALHGSILGIALGVLDRYCPELRVP
jgi:hypothetical protein